MNYSNSEPSAVDRACSASCTKAGIAALVFCTLALTLLHPLQQVAALNALYKYAGSRLALKTAIEFLDSDECWRRLRTEAGLEKAALVQVEKRVCYTTNDGKLLTDTERRAQQRAAPTPPPAPPAKSSGPAAPAAPSDLMLGFSSVAIDEIQKPLLELGDRQMLVRATSVFQFRFGWTIYWWQRRALDLSRRTTPSPKFDEKNFNFDKNLSFEDARVLADFQPLDLTSVERAVLDETRITLPNAGNALTLGISSNLIEFGILLSVFYFWLYQQEARESPTFPAASTVFAVFSRNRASRVVFDLLVTAPAWCAALLAFRSLESVRIGNAVIAAGITAVCLLILRASRQ